MNKLNLDTQARIIHALVEGNSIRSTECMLGVHRDTIMRLGVRVGNACMEFSNATIRGVNCKRIELDEIWCYVGKKQRHVTANDDESQVGDMWTWVAIDPDTKLVPSYVVGKRNYGAAHRLVTDLSSRLVNRVQLSSDGLALYVDAVRSAFGPDVDYGQIVKAYEAEAIGPGRYSPPHVTSVRRTQISGSPKDRMISTSMVERQNLTMRMQMRRFTRLTNAFSKKRENLEAAVALHFAYYNFCRKHGTRKATPAMAVGLIGSPMSVRELVVLGS